MDVVAELATHLPAVERIEIGIVAGALGGDRAILQQSPMAVRAFAPLVPSSGVFRVTATAHLIDPVSIGTYPRRNRDAKGYGRAWKDGKAVPGVPLTQCAVHRLVVHRGEENLVVGGKVSAAEIDRAAAAQAKDHDLPRRNGKL